MINLINQIQLQLMNITILLIILIINWLIKLSGFMLQKTSFDVLLNKKDPNFMFQAVIWTCFQIYSIQ